jgi:hypothetical protein
MDPVRWMVFFWAVRRRTPPECQVTRRPHSSVRCLVERVKADTSKEGRHHEHPIRARTRPIDPGLDAIISERRRLINLAYRLLGSLAEAEDAVRETYARWYTMTPQQQDTIESPGGWLTTVASRICLDLLGSARARRETYVGEWLPEPLPDPAEWPGGRRCPRTLVNRVFHLDATRDGVMRYRPGSVPLRPDSAPLGKGRWPRH